MTYELTIDGKEGDAAIAKTPGGSGVFHTLVTANHHNTPRRIG